VMCGIASVRFRSFAVIRLACDLASFFRISCNLPSDNRSLVLKHMSELGVYSRNSVQWQLSQLHAPVDPSRIQTLFAQAAGNVKDLNESLSHFEDLRIHQRSSSSHPEGDSALATSLSQTIAEFMDRGGSLPSAVPSSAGPSVLVFLDGLEFDYQLTEEDISKVFSRFGTVVNVSISGDGSNAIVTLGSTLEAIAAVSDLNGKALSGFQGGCLRVVAYGWSNSGACVPLIRKYTCRFDIQIENDKEFHVARRIIGQKGCNMKRIVKQAGYDAKLRLRGRGSGFLEGSQKQESQEPLHLCVSCKEYQGYRSAVDQVEQLLGEIYDEFREYCIIKGQQYPDNLTIMMHEHPLLYQPGSLELERNLSPPLTPMEPTTPLESMDVEQLIEARNEARRSCNFKEADKIREVLKSRGIGLMDEPGGRGRGAEVTSWRIWR
jgi:hypothetical protein